MILALLQGGPSTDQVAVFIPIVAILAALGIGIAIAIAVAYVKGRRIEADRDILARRLAYDQRLKELEVERLRLAGGGTGAAPTPGGTEGGR